MNATGTKLFITLEEVLRKLEFTEYNYKGSADIKFGPIAQQVEQVHPAVIIALEALEKKK